MSKDRYGHDYSDLLTMQREHLDRWQTRLVPEVFKAVKKFCADTNTMANGPEGKHRVHRGQDIVQLVIEWPAFNPAYFPPKEEPKREPEPVAADLI